MRRPLLAAVLAVVGACAMPAAGSPAPSTTILMIDLHPGYTEVVNLGVRCEHQHPVVYTQIRDGQALRVPACGRADLALFTRDRVLWREEGHYLHADRVYRLRISDPPAHTSLFHRS